MGVKFCLWHLREELKQSVEENTRTEKGWTDGRLDKTE
jgi:hypothetical protein